MADLLERLKIALADRYRIERELGAGGMATVYLAEDLKHKRKVAVKVLRPELAAVLGADRLHREIEIAANLTHPHILPLHDSGDVDGFLYYVMPHIEGESLRKKLAHEGELPIGEAVRILRDVVDALSEAHSKGLVHRVPGGTHARVFQKRLPGIAILRGSSQLDSDLVTRVGGLSAAGRRTVSRRSRL